jgi:DNA-directed RNA polymerase subunit H (RpoH/RPB5)
MSQSSEITEVFKARDNILKQLEFQGFDTSDYSGSNINEVNGMYNSKQLDMLVEIKKTNQKAYVKFHLGKSLRLSNIQEYIEDLFNLENILKTSDNLIIILKDEPNDSLIKIVKNIWEQQNIFIILYYIKRLQFNIIDHQLVPSHKVLTREESDNIKKKYNIQDNSQLPDISRFSPVALAIGLRPGDLCEIMRPSKTAIMAPFYRICSP